MGTLAFRVSVLQPQAHTAQLELDIPASVAPGDTVDVAMPAWCPGSYLVRDYARWVRDLVAVDSTGASLPITKLDKQTWRIARGAGTTTVRYTVYGHDLTVRTNHIDVTHAFLHGPATFLYVPAAREAAVTVAVTCDVAWSLVVGQPVRGERGQFAFDAANIDELYDAPLHLGQQTIHEFYVDGVTFDLALWGEVPARGTYDVATLCRDLQAILHAHGKRFGGFPFTRYAFVVMFVADGYGGLEHRNSSINIYGANAFSARKPYEGLLELLSHEFFHAYNGKRIAPAALLHFDYTKEAYTKCLWVMEGITSHYDRWSLLEAKTISAGSYFEKVLDDWTRLLHTPGRAQQSLEQSSFDAWIKLYKPDESNVNTTVSYYLKGGLVMFALDLHVRLETNGAKSLDDIMRALWLRYGQTGTPHPEELAPLFSEVSGLDLEPFFARYVRGTQDPPLGELLARVGLALVATRSENGDAGPAVWLGVTGSGRIGTVLDDTPAARAGLSPGDEWVALDGVRAQADADVRAQLMGRQPGDIVTATVFRRGRLHQVPVTLAAAPMNKHQICVVDAPSDAARAAYKAWIGEELGKGAIATVSITARML
ncbi:MAG: M61 family metallopeptidase [Myxococcales bacterium]|nr:M61 family metallopeptidase [Myxococcales bacterium]